MFIKSKRLLRYSGIFLCLLTALSLGLNSSQKIYNFTSSKGLPIKIIQNNNLDFVHAQLFIFNKNKKENPAVLYLTLLNIFNKELNQYGSSLLNILRKLGNDFTIQQRPDLINISINFLPKKAALFSQFLKELYSYKYFTLKKFNESIHKYWRYFLKQKNWDKELAFQLAYKNLFPGSILGNTLIMPNLLSKINLVELRSFHQRTFTLNSSLLIVKGNLNPYITFGLIEKAFVSYKTKRSVKYEEEPLVIKKDRKIIILDFENLRNPTIYWFRTIPPLGNTDHRSFFIVNNILFGYPIGRLFRKAVYFGIKIQKMDTEIRNHKNVSVVCNIIKLNNNDLEKFILMADNETRKLKIKRIDRKEYLDALNYFYGKLKVDTQKVDFDVEQEINKTIFPSNSRNLEITPQIFQQISLNSLNKIIFDRGHLSFFRKKMRNGIIIIVGQAESIIKNLNILKPTIIKYHFW